MPIRGSPNGAGYLRPQAGRDRPESVVAINRNGWSQSIGMAGRDRPVRAGTVRRHRDVGKSVLVHWQAARERRLADEQHRPSIVVVRSELAERRERGGVAALFGEVGDERGDEVALADRRECPQRAAVHAPRRAPVPAAGGAPRSRRGRAARVPAGRNRRSGQRPRIARASPRTGRPPRRRGRASRRDGRGRSDRPSLHRRGRNA